MSTILMKPLIWKFIFIILYCVKTKKLCLDLKMTSCDMLWYMSIYTRS